MGLILKKFNNCFGESWFKGIISIEWDKLKKLLTALVLFILVIGAFAAVSTPHAKAQETGQATIVSYSWYISQTQNPAAWAGDVVAVGEVQNTGASTLSTVSIRGVAYNSTGDALCTATAAIYAQTIAPGQKAPFYMDFDPEYSSISPTTLASNWASSVTNVTLYIGAQLTTNQTAYAGLTTSNLNHYVNSATYTVTGTITNTGSQTVGQVWAVTTFYDASGTVVAVNYTNYLDLSGSLTPGNGVTFSATPADNTAALTSKIASFSVLAETTGVISSSPTPTGSTTTPTPYSPTATPTQGSQSSTKPSGNSDLLTYGAVAAVVVVVAVLVALMMMRNRRKPEEFGPPPPPPPPPPPE